MCFFLKKWKKNINSQIHRNDQMFAHILSIHSTPWGEIIEISVMSLDFNLCI